MADPVITPLALLLISCKSDIVGGAIWDAAKTGGSALLANIDKNRDLEKLVVAAWNDSLKLLSKQHYSHHGLDAALIDLKNHGQAIFHANSPKFPHDISVALTFGQLQDIAEPLNPIIQDALAGSNHLETTELLLKNVLPSVLLSSFANQLKNEKLEGGFKGVVRDLLWDIANSNQTLINALDPDSLTDLKAQISALIAQNLPERLDEVLKSWEPALDSALEPIHITLQDIAEVQNEIILTQARTIDGQVITNQALAQTNLALLRLLDNEKRAEDAEKRAAQAELRRQLEEEARIRAEETSAQQAARIAELERSIPTSISTSSTSDLIAKAYNAVKEGRFIDAVRFAYDAESTDPHNPIAVFALAYALQHRPNGNRDQDLRDAISRYERLLRDSYTKEAVPQEWARTLNNLGAAYRDLPSGDKDQNIINAINAYKAALEVRTKESLPLEWSNTQNNLGIAYAVLPSGDREQNILNAIEAFEAVLEVKTKESLPLEWSNIQNNLGNAYSQLPSGNKDQNIKNAIKAYEAALEVMTKEAVPQEWAKTQNNLGAAYRNLPSGDKDQNIKNAIKAYEAALEVRTQEAFPQDWAETAFNMALIHLELKEFSQARAKMSAAAKIFRQIGHRQYLEHVEYVLSQLPE